MMSTHVPLATWQPVIIREAIYTTISCGLTQPRTDGNIIANKKKIRTSMENSKHVKNGLNASTPGGQVLDDMAAYIHRYLVCDDHQLAILALWSASAYCHNHFFTAPYLHIASAQPCAGKSLCLT